MLLVLLQFILHSKQTKVELTWWLRKLQTSATTEEKQKKMNPEESKGFVEEMRFVAMRLHTKDQAKEGEKESIYPEEGPVAKWEPTVEGYLRFLVDSKLVYDTLEGIIDESNFPTYAGFKNTGLERAEKLGNDLEWFKEQGHEIPEPMAPGITYSEYLKVLAENDPQAFICHFYNIYFAHSAGGRMIGRKVSKKILDNKELEFYKWDGQLSQMLQNVKEKLNKVAEWAVFDKRREESLFGRDREIVQVFWGDSSSYIVVTCDLKTLGIFDSQ